MIQNTALHKFTLLFSIFGVIAASYSVMAQNNYQLLKSIPMAHASFMGSDDLGNVYIVKDRNILMRYNKNGDSTGTFRNIQNGQLKWVDAKNPMKILLFYPQFSKIIMLDKMLSPKTSFDLKKLNLYSVTAAGSSADGNIWVYNESEAKLLKVNEQQQVIYESNDLRQETQTVPQPTSLIEKGGIVYLCDPQRGIYTFDRFAAYLNTLPFTASTKIQVIDDQIILWTNKKLTIYNKHSFTQQEISIPAEEGLIDVRVERERLYLLYPDQLNIYTTIK